ncbi:MAG TPA: hypothetical protein VLU96_05870 [Gaiellaceae bacterium]|nr:hypothetical protein [Gaiellaceae bacterium]
MKLAVGLGALLVLASIAAGCRHPSGAATTATSTTAASSGRNAIVAAVVGSPQAQGLPLFFPGRVGSRHCMIPEGGPAGLRISGVCSARVSYSSGRFSGLPVVLLTETWPWSAFHLSGSPRRAQHHTWAFLVRPSTKVVALGQSGDFPPQNAR